MFYFIIFFAIVARFVPHMPNFAPITAIAIFGAVHLPWKKAFGITFAMRFISDVFLGFVAWPMMIAIYTSHLIGILFGVWIKNAQTNRWIKIISSSILASGIFFLATNFAFLYSNYPHNFSGIIESYINGLPFLKGTLMGDLFYSVAFFGAYEACLFFQKYKKQFPYSNFRILND